MIPDKPPDGCSWVGLAISSETRSSSPGPPGQLSGPPVLPFPPPPPQRQALEPASLSSAASSLGRGRAPRRVFLGRSLREGSGCDGRELGVVLAVGRSHQQGLNSRNRNDRPCRQHHRHRCRCRCWCHRLWVFDSDAVDPPSCCPEEPPKASWWREADSTLVAPVVIGLSFAGKGTALGR